MKKRAKKAIFGIQKTPNILMLNSNHSPFGTILDNRNFGNSPRVGFNGQEKDNEISGNGNNYTAEFWQYDSRLGRRWNVDPILKPWESLYATFGNSPILFSDPNGNDINLPKGKEGRDVKKDIKYLKKHDSDFAAKWKAIEKEYKGKKDLNILRVENTNNTLADLKIQGNPRGTKESNKNQDYLYYSSKGDLKRENVAVTYQQDITSPPIDLRAGRVAQTAYTFHTTIAPEIFDKWTVANIPPSDEDFSFDLDFSNKKSVITKVNFTAINKIRKSELSYEHSYVSYEDALDITYTVRAMSVPIIVVGVITRSGLRIDYTNRVVGGNATLTKIVKLGPGEIITGAKIVK